jgi:hypothetical protein
MMNILKKQLKIMNIIDLFSQPHNIQKHITMDV